MTMRDCADGNMRDLLPGYVHGTLSAAGRAQVSAHLAGCEDCAAEVRLIESARAAYPTPAVNVARIVAALPRAPRTGTRPVLGSRQWLLAAGVSFLVLGAVSLAAIRGAFSTGGERAPAAIAPTARGGDVSTDRQAPPKVVLPARHESLVRVTHKPVGISFGGGLSDLSDDQLTTLLREIDSLDASPSAEPEPVKPIRNMPMTEGGTNAR